VGGPEEKKGSVKGKVFGPDNNSHISRTGTKTMLSQQKSQVTKEKRKARKL